MYPPGSVGTSINQVPHRPCKVDPANQSDHQFAKTKLLFQKSSTEFCRDFKLVSNESFRDSSPFGGPLSARVLNVLSFAQLR